MKILDSIKILIAPYMALFAFLVYSLTNEIKYLFLVGVILIIFSIVFLLILSFMLIRYGFGSIIEIEIEPLPWTIFFLTSMLYNFYCASLIFFE